MLKVDIGIRRGNSKRSYTAILKDKRSVDVMEKIIGGNTLERKA